MNLIDLFRHPTLDEHRARLLADAEQSLAHAQVDLLHAQHTAYGAESEIALHTANIARLKKELGHEY